LRASLLPGHDTWSKLAALWLAVPFLARCLPADDLSSYSSGSPAPLATAEGESPSGTEGASPAPGAAPNGASGASSPVSSVEASLEPAPVRDLSAPIDEGAPTAPDSGAPIFLPADCSELGEIGELESARCYGVSGIGLTWIEARDACREWGGALASITSTAEDDLLDDVLSTTVWIGASDLESEDTFTWDGGEPFEFNRFARGQPNDLFAVQDCVERRASDELWDDRDCDVVNPFVCERALRLEP
jgi:hypothetical protein